MPTPREIRESCGVSRDRAAVAANVSYPLAKLYESNPSSVKSATKRAQLDRVYQPEAMALLRPPAPGT